MLENKIIKLRALEPDDADILYKWENNTDVWKVSNTFVPISLHNIKTYIKHSHLDIFQLKELRLMITVKQNNLPVGTVDLFDFDAFHKRAGIGILIADTENRKQGYAKETLQIIINYAFNYLKLHQLYCNISADNIDSLKLFERAGFKITGTKKDWETHNNSYIDVYFLQLINDF
jgi:diamine N-acetyltransferase